MMNAITGAFVWLGVIFVAVYMLCRAKKMKRAQKEAANKAMPDAMIKTAETAEADKKIKEETFKNDEEKEMRGKYR